jgi:flagellar biosynthesis protein FliP
VMVEFDGPMMCCEPFSMMKVVNVEGWCLVVVEVCHDDSEC